MNAIRGTGYEVGSDPERAVQKKRIVRLSSLAAAVRKEA